MQQKALKTLGVLVLCEVLYYILSTVQVPPYFLTPTDPADLGTVIRTIQELN